MTRRMGLLVAGFDYSGANAAEFNDWYDTEHIPERLRTPGFVNARRWLAVDNPAISIATYDLESFAVLESPAYRAIAFENLSPWSKRMVAKCRRVCRFDGEQVMPGQAREPEAAGAVMLVAMNAAPEAAQELDATWRGHETSRVMEVPGCLAARRFQGKAGTHRYLALYHLAGPEVARSGAWKDAFAPSLAAIKPNMIQDKLQLLLRPYRRGEL